MKTSTTAFLALLAAATSTFATPIFPAPQTHRKYTRQDTPQISNWTAPNSTSGCSPAACTYSFNIATVSPPWNPSGEYPEPAFNAYCEGSDIQNKLVACNDTSVFVNAIPGLSNVTIVVQHTWQAGLGTPPGSGGTGVFNIRGNYTLVDGTFTYPASFEVEETEEYAVA